METGTPPSKYPQEELDQLAQRVESQRAELSRYYLQALRRTVFTNRIELRPNDLVTLAERETEAMLQALRSSFTTNQKHGEELCEAGLSLQSVFEILRVQGFFFADNLKNDTLAQEMISTYRLGVVESFTLARERVILSEQESIHSAFEIALKFSNQKIVDTQAEVQKATETSYRNVILAQEEERRKISRELHDEAGQAMVGIRMSLENLKSGLDGNAEQQTKLQKTINLTENAMQQIRALAYSLRPPMLDLLGVHLSIKQICVELADQTGLIINYSGKEIPYSSSELSISLYRIVQESLTNVVKHARARHVWVMLKPDRNFIELTIKDDGHGFDLKNIKPGMGLENMRERIRLLKGEMKIESKPDKLTLFKFTFPVKIE